MNYKSKTRKILRDCGAFVDGGHFVYSSGHHGDFYINKDALYMYPRKLDDICVMMTEIATTTFGDIFDIVLAPAVAGIVVGQNIAYNLSLERGKDILFAYADKNPFDETKRIIRRGYQHVIKDKRVLLVDDIANSGATLASMAQTVRAMGGEVSGAVVICDRGEIRTLKCVVDGDSPFEVKIESLTELDLQTFAPENCPLCKAGRPIDTELGEGASFDLFKEAEKVKEN